VDVKLKEIIISVLDERDRRVQLARRRRRASMYRSGSMTSRRMAAAVRHLEQSPPSGARGI